MDLVLYGKCNGYSPAEIAPEIKLAPEQVERVFRDIDAKRRVARYLHAPPALLEDIN
jgi:NAD+ synthase